MIRGTAKSFRVFVRNRWRLAGPSDGIWSDCCVPDPGARKTTLARHCTEAEARELCKRYAATHKPGRLGRKAEYEEE